MEIDSRSNPVVLKNVGFTLALCWLAALSPVFADRDSALGTINSSGVFTGGRSPAVTGDGSIKETESVLQADTATPNPLDSKIYHLRARCYGDTLIPLGRFGSGNFLLNWSTTGVVSSVSGSMSVASHWGDAAVAGPFIISQQESYPGAAKLRVIKGVGGDWEGAYLFLQYDHPYAGTEHTVSIAITTTQEIVESYELANAATATIVPVFSSASTITKRFDFYRDVTFSGKVTIPDGNLVLGTSSVVSNGGIVALGGSATANANGSVAIGNGNTASGEYSLAVGGGTEASGYSSTAMGAWTHATGDFSLAAGAHAAASARESIAIGSLVEATAQGAVVLGYSSKAEGLGSAAVGRGNRAVADFSFVAGVNNRATAYASTALGSKNIGIGSGGWNDLNPILEVGNGYPWGDVTSNAITTLVNGRTTLTNKFWVSTTPTVVQSASQTSGGDALSVEGHTDLKGNARVAGTTTLNGDTTLNGKVTLATAQGDISMGIYGN